ncbi:MAG: NAD(P)/FAD-dependent oxidoreductase, partial [Actinomycetota bacterium]
MSDAERTNGFDPKPRAVVIGSGSGGLTVAIGLSRFGRRVRMIERDRVGGDCTNVGCIPSKALLHATAEAAAAGPGSGRTGADVLDHVRTRRDELWQHETKEFGSTENIDLQFGTARIVGPGRVEVTEPDGSIDVVETEHIIVATGSRPRAVAIDGLGDEHLLTNENLFELCEPPTHLAIVGAGPIGVEMATAFARLGTRITLLDAADRVLPNLLPDASHLVARRLEAAGVDVRTGRVATSYDATSGRLTLTGGEFVDGVDTGGEFVDGVDKVLVAVGRVPNVDGLGLDTVGVETDRAGRIVTDANGRTSVEGV